MVIRINTRTRQYTNNGNSITNIKDDRIFLDNEILYNVVYNRQIKNAHSFFTDNIEEIEITKYIPKISEYGEILVDIDKIIDKYLIKK